MGSEAKDLGLYPEVQGLQMRAPSCHASSLGFYALWESHLRALGTQIKVHLLMQNEQILLEASFQKTPLANQERTEFGAKTYFPLAAYMHIKKKKKEFRAKSK